MGHKILIYGRSFPVTIETPPGLKSILLVKTSDNEVIYLEHCDNWNFVRIEEIIDVQNFNCKEMSGSVGKQKNKRILLEEDEMKFDEHRNKTFREIKEVIVQIRNLNEDPIDVEVKCRINFPFLHFWLFYSPNLSIHTFPLVK